MYKNVIKFVLVVVVVMVGIGLCSIYYKYYKKDAFSLSTFTRVPKEYMDVGCTYYLNDYDQKNGKRILVSTFGFSNDGKPIAYMIINGNPENFTEKESTPEIHSFSTNNYQIEINRLTVVPIDDESSRETGILTITDTAGNKVSKKFISFCGA